MRVLLVEDDAEFSEELAGRLEEQGMDTVAVDQGRAALEHCAEVDIVLLDLMLPDLDGFAVCQLIRNSSTVPIIIVSGRDDEFDRVLGLRMGADDFVAKPYRVRELTTRIEAVVRRARGAWAGGDSVKELGGVHLDLRLRRVLVNGEEVALTRKEFDLLAFLAFEPGRTFTRGQIMEEVWGHDGAGDTRTLGVHMTGLRKKLGVAGLIETVRGVGFRLVA
ncbi:response regulator transcription factor [Spirillospora sp. NPDC000708]|jgi:DNA-binding response OmpR family regulator|uniref:response regulator transcription factor n=1 Tax=Actinomadura TaxID=1988 RepID=UPI0016841C5A|nr:response regulator transcription factor [Actinomadura sp. RB99]MBD2892415.1 Sensory transduction protein regX3 [Actinomadura sp. RB99]